MIKLAPYITFNSHYNLDKSKKNWIKFFDNAKIPFVDFDLEFDIDYIDKKMPDFYFPKINLGHHFGETQDFFGALNYQPIDNYNEFWHTENLLSDINKNLVYIDFLVKNKKPIVFFKNTLDFTPTTVFIPSENNFEKTYKSVAGIPFAYLMKESYGSIWWAAGNEDFNEENPYKKLKKIIEIV